MKKYTIEFQLTPPHMHQRNSAEWSIRTCNNNCVAVFSTTYPYFSIIKCYRLLYQCLLTLNLIRNYRVNTALPAYAYLYGPYDFNKSRMEPPVTCTIAHKKTGNRTSWVHHVTPGWYIVTSLEHYIYIPTTGIEKITDTLQYNSKSFSFLKTNT